MFLRQPVCSGTSWLRTRGLCWVSDQDRAHMEGKQPEQRGGQRAHLGFQRPLLNLRDAFLHNEGDAIRAALGRLQEVLPEKLQLPLELLVPALDGQGLQALLVARQVALGDREGLGGGGQWGWEGTRGSAVGTGWSPPPLPPPTSPALPPHILPPGSTRSCCTPGTWRGPSASSAGGSELPWTGPRSGRAPWEPSSPG